MLVKEGLGQKCFGTALGLSPHHKSFLSQLGLSRMKYDLENELRGILHKPFSFPNSTIYDLGCSTATTLINIAKQSDKKLDLIGIDTSEAMLNQAKHKSKAYGIDIEFINNDIFDVEFKKSNVIISNYTLQFIRPLQREKLIKKIYDSLEVGSVFIFSEKVITDDKILNKQFIDEYYNFKKTQGYSEFEIAQKREALENVLIPYSYEENKKMILDAGFKHFDCIFKWINFATFIAIK